MSVREAASNTSSPRLGLQSVTLVAGLITAALAASAMIGWGSSEPATSAPSRVAASPTHERGQQAAQVVYYFVNSVDQAKFADFIEEDALQARVMLKEPELNRRVYRIEILTAKEELAWMSELSRAMNEIGSATQVQIIDLRDVPAGAFARP